jgi:benzoate-CoA ligase family protein
MSESEERGRWVEVPREYNAASHFIDRHVGEGRGGKVAYIDDRGSYTYAELATRVNRAGNVLKGLGVEMEQRVLLCLSDGIDFVALFWGAVKIGAIPVPVNTLLTPADYDFMLRDSRAKVLAVSAPLRERFATVLGEQPFLKCVVVCGPNGSGNAAGDAASEESSEARSAAGRDAASMDASRGAGGASIASYEALAGVAAATLEAAPTVADDVALWLYSSGSTGRPKGVLHLHRSLVQTAALYADGVLGMREYDVVFSASKMFFAYGLGNAMSFPLHAGATAILMAERPTPATVMRMLSKYQPTIFCGVPTLYAAILTDAALAEATGSARLRICTSAGEALPEPIARRWSARFGVEIFDGLGSTEALHIFVSNRAGAIRYGSSGRPVPGYEVSLRDENGVETTDGEIGDLWCRGPSIGAGYWNNREATIRTFVGGWLKTGDKYVRDADGYYHFAGRSDDMLKVGGVWVSPFEVETVLLEHPQVREAAVIGAADAESLVKPKAFVVLKDSGVASAALAEELKEFVKARVAPYKYPRWIEFRDELPRTATGKLRRFELTNKN